MLGAVLSFFRSVLWAANVALAIIVLAVLVAPLSAVTNMANWLSVLGLTKQADWLIAHAHSGFHFSAHPLVPAASTTCARFVCGPQSSAFDVTLSVIAMLASAGIIACSILLWVLPRIGRIVQVVRADWFHHDMAHHNPL